MDSGQIDQPAESKAVRVLLVAWIILFVVNFEMHKDRGPGTAADTFEYLTPVLNWFHGYGFTYQGEPALTFPPGYGLRTLPLYLAGVELVHAAIITNAFFLAIACMFIYMICRFYVSRIFALVAILFVVTNAYIMWLTTLAMSEVTFMAVVAGAAYFVLRFIRRPRRNPLDLAVAGLFAGCAVLTRPEGLGVAMLLVFFLTADLIVRQPPPRLQARFAARLACYALIFLAPVVILYSPYVVYMSKNFGHFTLSGKYEMDVMEGNVRAAATNTLQFDLDKKKAMAEGAKSTFSDDVRRVKVNLPRYAEYAIEENHAPLAALVLVVVIGMWRGGFRRALISPRDAPDTWEGLAFCVLMLVPVLPMSFFLSEARLFTPYCAFVIIGSVILMGRVVAGPPVGVRKVDPRVYASAVAVPLVLFGVSSNTEMWRKPSPDQQLQRGSVVLASLRHETPINLMALRRGEVASYYANGSKVLANAAYDDSAPDVGPNGVAATMREKGLKYLLIDRFYIETRPALSVLWTCAPAACPGGVRLIAEDPGNYRIFELTPEGGRNAAL